MECEKIIFAGVDVGGKHYSLQPSDQSNILGWEPYAKEGKSVLYHADGEPCRMFTAEEFMEVATTATFFIAQQRTYCNLLMQQLKTLTDVDAINAVKYGETQLEGDFLDIYQELLSSIQ